MIISWHHQPFLLPSQFTFFLCHTGSMLCCLTNANSPLPFVCDCCFHSWSLLPLLSSHICSHCSHSCCSHFLGGGVLLAFQLPWIVIFLIVALVKLQSMNGFCQQSTSSSQCLNKQITSNHHLCLLHISFSIFFCPDLGELFSCVPIVWMQLLCTECKFSKRVTTHDGMSTLVFWWLCLIHCEFKQIIFLEAMHHKQSNFTCFLNCACLHFQTLGQHVIVLNTLSVRVTASIVQWTKATLIDD